MRFAVAIIGLSLLVACSSPVKEQETAAAAPAVDLIPCTDPRPEVCTMEYAPACAELSTGGRREYASGCSACSDDEVTGYRPGSCPQ